MEEIVRKAKTLYSSHFAQKVNKILLTYLIRQKTANEFHKFFANTRIEVASTIPAAKMLHLKPI